MSEFKPCLYLPGLLLNLPKDLAWGASHAATAHPPHQLHGAARGRA